MILISLGNTRGSEKASRVRGPVPRGLVMERSLRLPGMLLNEH